MTRPRLLAALAGLILLWAGWAGPAGAFGIDDYFRLRRVAELALSPDGRWLAYVVERQVLGEDSPRREVLLQSTRAGAAAARPAPLAEAADLAWTAGGELAFLDGETGQVALFSPETGAARAATRSPERIVAFRFSRDGRKLAYLSRAAAAAEPSLYDRFRTADRGLVIDFGTVSLHDFLNPAWNAMVRPGPASLWIQAGDREAVRVKAAGVARFTGDFRWAPDGRRLSAVIVGRGAPVGILQEDVTSLAVLDAGSGALEAIAAAQPPKDGRPGVSYDGGEWTDDGRLLARRTTETDPWVSSAFPDWAVTAPSPAGVAQAAWRAAELHPRGMGFAPGDGRRILVESIQNGVRGLFVLGPRGLAPAVETRGLDGSSSLFSFSRDRRSVAFVNESLSRPPEVYLRDGAGPPRRLTELNDELAARVRFGWREVSWRASDGVTVRGWLLTPPKAEAKGPTPLIVHVHGGPAYPFPNAFAPYFPMWAYPLEVYAQRGFAVFLPNYRGTHSYGRRIAEADAGDAVDDIVTGVRALVAAGVADPARLGISGHSHGAQEGSMAMAKSGLFAAASFAEGVANSVVMYELVGDEANREIHDRILGASLYQDPQRYLADSPDLHFRGVTTPTLFEGGAHATALVMLGFPKAARRAGMPTEFVIYPKTGHNLAIASLQREAAQRNLDWFTFWLREEENPGSADPGQYARWRALRRAGADADRDAER